MKDSISPSNRQQPLSKPADFIPVEAGQVQAGISRVHSDSATYVEALRNKQRGWLARFFTERGLVEVLKKQDMQRVEEFGEAQRQLFRIATDAKLTMASNVCLTMCRELSLSNQERFTRIIMERQESLRLTVRAKQEAFMDSVDAAMTSAERYATPSRMWLAERAFESLHRETENFYGWLESLLNDFMSISKQRLDDYRAADRPRDFGFGSNV